jgi:hypothetical protein
LRNELKNAKTADEKLAIKEKILALIESYEAKHPVLM